MVCKGDLNISLDEMCNSNMTAAMLLEGDIFPNHLYTITIMENGIALDKEDFNGSDIGCVSATAPK